MKDHFFQVLLIASTLAFSWLAMMAVHELGHVLHAWLSGGRVVRVSLPPAGISRTDVSPNPAPRFVAWGGALWGCAIPLLTYWLMRKRASEMASLMRFFAGFCLIANGAYLGAGVLAPVGDASDLLRAGARPWQLGLFGLATIAAGLWLWNGLGTAFGLGREARPVSHRVAVGMASILVLLVLAECLWFWWS